MQLSPAACSLLGPHRGDARACLLPAALQECITQTSDSPPGQIPKVRNIGVHLTREDPAFISLWPLSVAAFLLLFKDCLFCPALQLFPAEGCLGISFAVLPEIERIVLLVQGHLESVSFVLPGVQGEPREQGSALPLFALGFLSFD